MESMTMPLTYCGGRQSGKSTIQAAWVSALAYEETADITTKATPVMVVDDAVTVGDLDSDERGSGARKSSGKVPYDLLPLKVVLDRIKLNDDDMDAVLSCMALWQAGNDASLEDALDVLCVDDDLTDFAGACRVLEYGQKKYKAWNWAKGMPWSVPLGCIVRHCLAVEEGVERDEESGQRHTDHVICNLLMLLTYRDTYPEGDDRPVKWLKGTV